MELIKEHAKKEFVAKGYDFDDKFVDDNIKLFYCLYVSKKTTPDTEAPENEDLWVGKPKNFRALLTKVRTSGGKNSEFEELFRYEIIQKLWFGGAAGTGFKNSEELRSFMPEYLRTQRKT